MNWNYRNGYKDYYQLMGGVDKYFQNEENKKLLDDLNKLYLKLNPENRYVQKGLFLH